MPRPHADVSIPLLGFNPSGGVRMALHVANALAARGRRVVVSAPRGDDPPLAFDPGVSIARHGPGRGAFVASLPSARVHVATGWQTPVLIAIGSALRARRARIFHLIQGDEVSSHIDLGPQPAWLKPVLRAVARGGQRIPATRVAVSEFVAGRVGRGRILRVIPPGIDVQVESGRSRARAGDGPPVAGVISNPARAKGVAFALTALARLAQEGSARAIAFDGAHPLALPPGVPPFSRFAAENGLERDLAAFYRACDVFVFPSLVEGFGLPPLEAMAHGAAVVVTDCGGVREYARDGVNCRLVPAADADRIADAVRELAGNDELRARLRAGGLETAARFTAARFAGECADEIERLLADGGIRD